VSYTRDGNYLVTGARQDAALLVWDLRYADQALYRLEVRGTYLQDSSLALKYEQALSMCENVCVT